MADPRLFSKSRTTGECNVTLSDAGPDVNPFFAGHARLAFNMDPSDGRYAEVMLDPDSARSLRDGLTAYLEEVDG